MLVLPDTLRIFIIEDDEEDYHLTERVVRNAVRVQTEIRWARSLEEAIRLRAVTTPDLLLLDYNLPGTTGENILRAFRERGWLEPAIVLTSLDGHAAHVVALQAGADDFLCKQHLDGPSLERAIRYVLERSRTQAALQEQAQLHKGLFDSSPIPKIVYDEETLEILDTNRAGIDLYGYSRAELLDQSVLDIRPVEDIPRVRELLLGLRGINGTIHHGPSRHLTKDGRLLRVEITSNNVAYTGRRARMAAIVDMTERLAAQEALRESEQRLQQAQKVDAVGQLAGGIAHDFNNLLTAIRGYSDLLFAALPEGSELRQDVTEIMAAADRAAALTGQLLAFSRRQVMQLRLLELGTVVREMQGMLERIIGEDLELVVNIDDRLRAVRADRSQIEQVIVNLAVNARDAMPDGGALSISLANVHLDESFVASHPGSQVGPHVRISVVDTGRGMTAEVQERLFEPFFTTKPEGKGTGLGLATVYGIVKQSGGYISVRSTVGAGSEFSIYLPDAGEAADVEVEAAPVIAAEVPCDETVLIVEDSPAVRTIIRRALEAEGYTVLEATDGMDGLAVVESPRQPIDLIITDLVMPRMGGRGFVESLQSWGVKIPVLVMSGYVNDAAWRDGVFPSHAGFISKPFSTSEITRRVRMTLDAAA